MSIKIHIIARLGSKRLKRKNLRLLDGKPMMCYAIEAAKRAESIDEVYLNSDSELLGNIALEQGIQYYKRKPELAKDNIVLDQLTYDFIQHVNADIVGMVNPVCPLTTAQHIEEGLQVFLKNDLDTLLTVREEYLHAFMDGRPLNIKLNTPIPMTQNLSPIQLITWNFCFWKATVFKQHFEKHGHGVFSGKLGFYTMDKTKSIKVSEEADFQLAEALLKQVNHTK